MAGLYLYRSNRLESLVAALGEVLANPASAPLESELVIVQSLGMRRWLSLELARQLEVTMNIAFPFPGEFVHRAFSAVFPGLQHDRAFDRALLPWRVLECLQNLEGEAFEEVRQYLAGEMRPLKEYQLASKIAATFDRYLAYRPELILEWQRGQEGGWQAELWRALSRGHERAHPPALALRFREVLSGGAALDRLPSRIAVFGISSLPPFHLQILGEIATRIDVHFFQLDPTDQFWGDLVSQKEQDRVLRRERRRSLTADDLHLEIGHSLLGSLGRVGRDFSKLLLDLEPTCEIESFAPPAGETLLAQIQANIFALCERPSEALIPVAAGDRSVEVHCCHSPLRELEVLHDQLLARFAADPTLTPRDILVAMPDVETYAPFIEAVFSSPERPELQIPFSIADRSVQARSPLADALLRILDLRGSRFGAGSVLSLLEVEPIQRRFGFSSTDPALLRTWVEQTGIRWGIDGAHRAELGLPAFPENTWRAGLRRLLLGYALPGDGDTLFAGVLPEPQIEGTLALTLGKFVDFAETLFAAVDALKEARPLGEWARTLNDLLRMFFDDREEDADEIRRLRSEVEGLAAIQRDTGFSAPVAFEVLRAHLADTLEESDSGSGFLAGRVTFCALKPMRSIPFKIICLLGMNDGAFPRHESALAFDLVANFPRLGDRALRDDDRYLFLESILSAREALYLSYCGRSPRDNSELPPSVLVSELLEYLRANFALKDSFITQHRLQPFSQDYFRGDSELFSFSQENCRASERCHAPRAASAPFVPEPLSPPEESWREVDVHDLAAFFCHPARAFVRDRLGLRLPREVRQLEECEPLELNPLERTRLQVRLADRALQSSDASEALAVLRAAGVLPAGYVGDLRFAEVSEKVAVFVEALREIQTQLLLPPVTVDLAIGQWRVTGTIQDVRERGLVRARASDAKPADRLRAWVLHLALNASAPEGYPRETLLLATDTEVRFLPMENAAEILLRLLERYGQGMCAPLPFFPKTSFEFASALHQNKVGKKHIDPLKKARGVWTDGTAPERVDPHYALCFGHLDDPFDAAWEELAREIFGPLLDRCAP